MSEQSISQTQTRLTCIDETRALAIISMIIMHFGPGVFERLPQLSFLADPILFLGRFATTTFILVFGVTIGFAYYHRFEGQGRKDITKNLLKRSRLLLLCSLIICVPLYVNLIIDRDWNTRHWLFSTYSILNYYTLALLSVPVWLWAVRGRHFFARCLCLGAGHWALASLVLAIWPLDPGLGFSEYARMHLASGPYGYLQLSGSAIMAIPVGYALRRAMKSPRGILPTLWKFIPGGLAIALVGFGIGVWLNEFSVAAIIEGTVKTPPRAWYFLFFGGLAMGLLSLTGILGQSLGKWNKALYPLSLFGQASLAIYTGHRFVLPSLGWLDASGLKIEGVIRIVLPFLLFAFFCAFMMFRQHRIAINKSEGKETMTLWHRIKRVFNRSLNNKMLPSP